MNYANGHTKEDAAPVYSYSVVKSLKAFSNIYKPLFKLYFFILYLLYIYYYLFIYFSFLGVPTTKTPDENNKEIKKQGDNQK